MIKRVLIELPTWMGDCVMSTPAIKTLLKVNPDVKLDFIGPDSSLQLLKNFPSLGNVYKLDKSLINMFKTTKNMDPYELAISFRSSLRSSLLLFLINSKNKHKFHKNEYSGHQVEKYNSFINSIFGTSFSPEKQELFFARKSKISSTKRIIGINPGAAYGSAKRWSEEGFIELIEILKDNFFTVIFGGANEKILSQKIRQKLGLQTQEYRDLAGKTSIQELIEYISNLDVFVTGDSGPMHIAAALNIPTVSIFGPTKDNETSQWMNKKNVIVKLDLDCQPCMQRECPLKHNNCMNMIDANMVYREIRRLL